MYGGVNNYITDVTNTHVTMQTRNESDANNLTLTFNNEQDAINFANAFKKLVEHLKALDPENE